ncbi:antichymotrypsin-2-like [Epargyreus clarus]|uniref:antichymotrypsin-2-like n=1 Tax=Epargyreus clarus TaxID=520877 RepID=UPI003C2D59CE
MKRFCFLLFVSAIAMADDTNLEEVLHKGSNQFTANMFSEVAKDNPKKSIVLSAFSVMTPLAQLALASVGPSHDELLQSMGLPNDQVTKDVFSLVDTKLRSVKGVEMKTASKIYIPLNYELNPEFEAVSRDVFHSKVENVNFVQSDPTAKLINDWVEEQTNHRIKDLVDPSSLNKLTRAVLVNALYFKGSWETPFKKHYTQDREFHVSKEKSVQVPMMFNKADFRYGESEVLKSKLLEMDYVGEQSSMLIVLPDEVDGLEALMEKLKDLSILDSETKKMFEVEVAVSLPKFKIETTTDLKETLKKMNVNKLFNPEEAHLDKLIKDGHGLYVSNAVQKAFIEVNEEGAEAAASNQFGIAYLSAITNIKEYKFNANHPFAFFLKQNGNILFSGLFYA